VNRNFRLILSFLFSSLKHEKESRAERERTEESRVEWSGVECKQHVLSRERTKYHFTQTTHSVVVVVVRKRKKHREERKGEALFLCRNEYRSLLEISISFRK
jgi:hypothetical protein